LGGAGHARARRKRRPRRAATAASGAKTYVVKVLLSDGRGLQRTLKASQRRLSIPRVGKGVHAKVTVTPVGPDGRHGPARRILAP